MQAPAAPPQRFGKQLSERRPPVLTPSPAPPRPACPPRMRRELDVGAARAQIQAALGASLPATPEAPVFVYMKDSVGGAAAFLGEQEGVMERIEASHARLREVGAAAAAAAALSTPAGRAGQALAVDRAPCHAPHLCPHRASPRHPLGLTLPACPLLLCLCAGSAGAARHSCVHSHLKRDEQARSPALCSPRRSCSVPSLCSRCRESVQPLAQLQRSEHPL